MSRLVMLTDEEIKGNWQIVRAVLEQRPEEIAEEMVRRGALKLAQLDIDEREGKTEGRPYSFGDKSLAVLEAALHREDGAL